MSKSGAAVSLRFQQLAEQRIEEHMVLLAIQYEGDDPPSVDGDRYVVWGGPEDYPYFVCAKSGKHVRMARAEKQYIDVIEYARVALGKSDVSPGDVDQAIEDLAENSSYDSGDEVESWPKYSEHELARRRKSDVEKKEREKAAKEKKAPKGSNFNPQPKPKKGSGDKERASRRRKGSSKR